MLARHDNLWLDTTMMAADFFPIHRPVRLLRARTPLAWLNEHPTLPVKRRAGHRPRRRSKVAVSRVPAQARDPDPERPLPDPARVLFIERALRPRRPSRAP
jgi:hypothetical protein